jgi:hypothetical protein
VGGMAHEAGDAYVKAAELFRGDILKNPNEAAKAFTQAGTFVVLCVVPLRSSCFYCSLFV